MLLLSVGGSGLQRCSGAAADLSQSRARGEGWAGQEVLHAVHAVSLIHNKRDKSYCHYASF